MNLELMLEVLRELSDADYQAALWVGELANEQSSFTEAACALFDDAGLTRALYSGILRETYSNELCQCAQQLITLATLIDDTGTPEQTLNHPKMNDLREAASELYKRLWAESQSSTPDYPSSQT